MKKIALLLLMMLTAVSYAQQPRPKFSSGSRNMNFTDVVVGKTKQLSTTFRVDSTASAPVTVLCRLPRHPEYQFIGDTQFTIPLGGFQDVTIEFTPTVLGSLFDTILFTHDGDTTSIKASSIITLRGTGIAYDSFPKIAIQPQFGFLQFGSVEVGKSSQRSFLIQNVTDTVRQLTGTISPAPAPFSFVSGGDPFSLESYDTQRVWINFAPTKDTAYFDSVIVTSNADSANRIKKIFFLATGTKPGSDTIPRITITGTGGGGGGGVNFGNVRADSSGARYITIRNTSIVNKQLIATVGLPTMSVFTVDSGGGTLTIDSGMTSLVKLRFSPIAPGSYRDSLYVTSNAVEPNNNLKVILRGETVATSVEKLPHFVRNISLFPNPATDNVSAHVVLTEPSEISLSLYDIQGNIVMGTLSQYYPAGKNVIPFDVRTVLSGTYTARFKFSGSAVSILMVIER